MYPQTTQKIASGRRLRRPEIVAGTNKNHTEVTNDSFIIVSGGKGYVFYKKSDSDYRRVFLFGSTAQIGSVNVLNEITDSKKQVFKIKREILHIEETEYVDDSGSFRQKTF